MIKRIRVVLAEDHHVVRSAFAALLSKEADIEVVGEVADTAVLLDTVAKLKPDVLILDAHMPGGKVITTARKLREEQPRVRVLVLSGYERNEYIVGLVRAGVAGYVLKHDSTEMLTQAVRAVARGEEWLSPRVADILMKAMRSYEDRPAAKLTGREVEVLKLMAQGRKNGEIAEDLVITTSTVKNHVRRIFRKLDVDTRVDAVLYAIEHELDRTSNASQQLP
ncbi:MAG: response regulator transcription factor [Anaerolineaceae bacterium]|nr:response regulator transcription factor [Anaerolineaceae bacterium]